MAQPPDPYGGNLYEILKIWVPTHGVINVYRKPGQYHVDNGFLLKDPVSSYGIETLRILASHGSVIKITRDGSLPKVQNKYTITPPELAVDASTVNVKDW
ncbi:unnamed protein product [Porites evermanni]|uniref:Uncharacterized protein n=1 Tax=Porites evermanni TaxID=104178 RepID=A0ABN8M8C9_9CNID|nr:unnamed protein product [Porites evermanni]